MTCRNCGTEIAANALICYRCGTAVEELPHVAPAHAKRGRAGLIGPALMLVVLLVAVLLATRVMAPELPRTIVWIVVALALLLTGWWIARRRASTSSPRSGSASSPRSGRADRRPP